MGIKDVFVKRQDADTETTFQARFEKDEQITSALSMVGAGFEARGGSSLMLTEAVENGVDAIIDLKKHKSIKGHVRVIIDEPNERILIVDNGTGFLRIKHVCEKPFDSLKKYDSDQTGKFARGLQGFRAFCDKLTYLTRRPQNLIPSDERSYIKNNEGKLQTTALLRYESSNSRVKVKYVNENDLADEFINKSHGTVAVYDEWKPGEFEKFNTNMMIRRLQHHFGEMIRDGDIKIAVEVREGRIQDIGPEQVKKHYVEPRDYSEYKSITLDPIPYNEAGVKGEITFNLFLCDRGRSSRWNYPYLLYEKRPVGDGFIAEIDEFSEHPIWKHKFLTGFITCDFCEINELRQGLRINHARDFLFKELLKLEKILEKKVKEHGRGLYELKLQSQVNDLVKDLQMFFKDRNIFNFKKAKSMGFISNENPEVEIVELAKKKGEEQGMEVSDPSGDGTEVDGVSEYSKTGVDEESGGDASPMDPETGLHGGVDATAKAGSPTSAHVAQDSSSDSSGFTAIQGGMPRSSEEEKPHSPGGTGKTGKKGKRHRPRGFGIAFQDDEFNDDLSWFDEITHMVIINSQHPRFLGRQEESNLKDLMDYLAELYIWEITKLVHGSEEEDVERGMAFLKYKFEYEEHVRSDSKQGKYVTA